MLNIRIKGAVCKGIGFRNSPNFCIRNCTESGKILLDESESRALGSRIQLKDSGILLTIGINRESFSLVGTRNPSYNDKDWNKVRRMQIPKLYWIALLGANENQWAWGDRERLQR